MSRKIRKVVASTLALAMMTGTAANFPAGQFAVLNAATAEQAVSTSNVAGGLAGPTIDAGTYEVKAGETFKVKIKATGNTDGFNALNTWLDVDTNVFEIVGKEAGDIDDPENEDSYAYSNVTVNTFKKSGAAAGVETLLALYSDTDNAKGDMVIATYTLKVKDGAKDGYYSLPFDAKGDGGAMGNRINSDRTPLVINPTFKGASITVGNPSSQPTAQTPASQAPASQAPASQTPASQTPASQTPAQSGTLSGKIADASAKAGETVKTTLSISGVDFAGFAAELSFSGLELTKATADGFDVEIQGKKIVGLANPYKDVSSATVNLEFKTSAAGSYEVSASSLEAASKDKEKEFKGSVTKGTVTVSGASSNPTSQTPATQTPSQTPASQAPSSDAIQIEIGKVAGKPGEKVKVPVTVKNVGDGFSALQFDYAIDGDLMIGRGIKGDFACSWTIGKTEKSAQFLEGDGMNISGEGVIGKLEVEIPADAKEGTVYNFKISNFEGAMVDKSTGKQVKLAAAKFAGTAGYIAVGELPSEAPASQTPASQTPASQTPASQTPATTPSETPNSDAIQIVIDNVAGKAGEKVKIPVTAKNVGDGFSALQFDYDIDGDLKVGRGIKGDFACSWTIGKTEKSAQFLEGDGMNISGDGVIGKLEVEIPADAKEGTVYKFKISNFEGAVVDKSTGKQVKLDGSKFAGVAGTITVGDKPVSSDPTVEPTVSVKPTETAKPTEIPTTAPSNSAKAEQPVSKTDVQGGIAGPKVDAGTYKVKAGDKFDVQIKVTDNKDGFNALNAWLDVDTDVFEITAMEAGDTSDPENEDSVAYSAVTLNKFHKDGAPDNITTILALFSDTENAADDQVIATITLTVKAGVKDGYYTLPFDAKGDGGAMANRVVVKDGDRSPVVLNPTFVGALVTVGDPAPATETPTEVPTVKPTPATAQPTATTEKPSEEPPAGDAIKIKIGEINGNAGEKVKVPVYAENVGGGFSALQFDYDIDGGLTIGRGIKGDFACSWTIGKTEKSAQFLEGDGMNISGDGCIGKFEIEIPKDAKDGTVYNIKISNFEGAMVDSATNKQVKLESSKFEGVAGKITVGEVTPASESPSPSPAPTQKTTEPSPTAPATDAPKSDAISIEIGTVYGAAGEKVKVPVTAKNVGNGFSALQFDYDIDGDLTIGRGIKGDFGCSWTIGKTEKSAQFLEADGMNISGDGVIGKFEIEIPKDAKDGTVYNIKISNFEGAMVDSATNKQVKLDADKFTAVAGKIIVGKEAPTTEPTAENTAYDVNGDGSVNTADIIALKKYLLLVKDAKVVNGDINGDGIINSMDMVRLVNKLLG
ncbi:cohesin domain-containing protein [Ruminococcus sp. HUN007]|uniref:cohesin domain-containing protein n=1 Tax=Ruminococcus sp. HUN007 TaxID=1514668 RepID=UPI0005D15EB1|nr:cohesin domain-containing protein [Ruminococcus sp. HUN007]